MAVGGGGFSVGVDPVVVVGKSVRTGARPWGAVRERRGSSGFARGVCGGVAPVVIGGCVGAVGGWSWTGRPGCRRFVERRLLKIEGDRTYASSDDRRSGRRFVSGGGAPPGSVCSSAGDGRR